MVTSVLQSQQYRFDVRKMLSGQKFASDTEVQSVVHQWLGTAASTILCIGHSQAFSIDGTDV